MCEGSNATSGGGAQVPPLADREQVRRDEAMQMLSAPSDGYSTGAWCELANYLAAELGQAERERDFHKDRARTSHATVHKLEARLAAVPALVEALRQIAADVPFMMEPRSAYTLAREALAAYEQAQEQR